MEQNPSAPFFVSVAFLYGSRLEATMRGFTCTMQCFTMGNSRSMA